MGFMIDHSLVMKMSLESFILVGEKKLDYEVDGKGFDYLMCNWHTH